MTAIVEAQRLQRTYGEIRAVEDVSFSIETREIFGLLGPNGAGKTTTLRMLSGLTAPDGGQAVVDGCDVIRDPVGAKKRLGVVARKLKPLCGAARNGKPGLYGPALWHAQNGVEKEGRGAAPSIRSV